jgi:[methyl-Co(III) methanol-specific corrinoid protein]:coenzyme M methyltransferase
MESMTARERFFAILEDKPADRPAVINPTSVATTEAINELGLDFAKVHTDPEATAALACYSYEKTGFDSITPYFSVVAEAAALGADMEWGDNRSFPNQRSRVFSEPEQIKIPEDFLDKPSTGSIIEAIKKIKAQHGDRALLIGKAMGPWTLSLHLFGLENTLIATIDEKEKLKAMLKEFLEFTKLFTTAQLESGADMITIADHATRNLISPRTYEEFVLPLHKELCRQFKGKLILHCCGNTEDRVEYFAQAGFPLFHFESSNNVKTMLTLAREMALTGCINNPVTLYTGAAADVFREAEEILNSGIKLLSPECAIPLSVKNENLRSIVNCAARYRKTVI